MGFATVSVLHAALFLGGLNLHPVVSPSEFREWFETSLQGELELPPKVIERARRTQFVFVLGLLNERMPGYFKQTIKELRSLGVPHQAIHQIAPSSDKTFEENLVAIRGAFRRIAASSPKPIVIIGHSRGACDALGFALREPEFIRDRVIALFLIQGPFGGSAAADYLLGSGAPLDNRMPPPARVLAGMFRILESRKLDQGRHEGITDLESETAARFWQRQLVEHAGAVPVLDPRTFYLEATTSPARQPLLRRPIARYLETYYGPNDGLVASGDQSLDGLGTRLGMLAVSHTDLTHRFPAARPRRRLRSALAESIVMAVARPPSAETIAGTNPRPLRIEDRDAPGSAQGAPR